MNIIKLAGIDFEELGPIDCDGIPSPPRLKPLNTDPESFAFELYYRGEELKSYLDAIGSQALWIVGLPNPMPCVHSLNTETVQDNYRHGLNTKVHDHDMVSLDLVSSLGAQATRAPFDLFTHHQIEELALEHWDEVETIMNALPDKPEFLNLSWGSMMRKLPSIARCEVLWGDKPDDLTPHKGFFNGQEGAARAWRFLVSNAIVLGYGSGLTPELTKAEEALVPTQRVDWTKGDGHSGLIFRGFHRGNLQVHSLGSNNAKILHTPLLLKSKIGLYWGYNPNWEPKPEPSRDECWGEQ